MKIRSAWRTVMDWINPVEWCQWTYEKWFIGNYWKGFFTIWGITIVLGGVLTALAWGRGVDKYNKENPSIPPPSDAITAKEPGINPRKVEPSLVPKPGRIPSKGNEAALSLPQLPRDKPSRPTMFHIENGENIKLEGNVGVGNMDFLHGKNIKNLQGKDNAVINPEDDK